MLQQSKPVVELYKEPSIIEQMIEDAIAPKPLVVKEIKPYEQQRRKMENLILKLQAATAYAKSVMKPRLCNCCCAPCLDGDCGRHINPPYDTGIPHAKLTVSAQRIDKELGL